MSKQIIIEGSSGVINIRKSRQATNESNWKEDYEVWNKINCIELNDPHLSKSINKKGKIEFKYLCENGFTKTGKPKFKIDSDISNVITTLAQKIANNNCLEYDITYEDEVEFWMILDMLDWLLDARKSCQKYFCRNASRQSVDEDVQLEMLRQFTGLKVEKPTNGTYTVANGDIKHKNDIKDDDNQFARSVDAYVPAIEAYGFLKQCGPIGSVTSVLQVGESISFIDECIKYHDKHLDDTKFFVQVDGVAGEEHIPEMKKLIGNKYEDIIIAGNSKKIIGWLNRIK